mgnify:CR=1 FL=1|jgi:hypothetical protein
MKCGTIVIKKMKMRKILQKIAWKTHRWAFKYSSFNLYLGAEHNKFGFQIMNIQSDIFWEGSLFEITWTFPTVTHRGDLRIDILFLFDKWDNWCINMNDEELWGYKLSRWERFNTNIHNKFKSIG